MQIEEENKNAWTELGGTDAMNVKKKLTDAKSGAFAMFWIFESVHVMLEEAVASGRMVVVGFRL